MIKQFIKGLRPKTIKLDTAFENKIEFAKFLAGRVEIYELNGDKFEMFFLHLAMKMCQILCQWS